MALKVHCELPAEPIDIASEPLLRSQQQPPQLPPRGHPTPYSGKNEASTIRGVPGDDPSLCPLPLFTRRSKSNLLNLSSDNNTTPPLLPDRRRPATNPSSEPDISDIPPPLPGNRPALPPKRISQHLPSEVHYTRDAYRVIAYLIPLPKPITISDEEFPQRYLIYTPRAAHLLKPADGIKEGKRDKAKRFCQREVKKAKTYDGKTVSLKGLHSKATRGGPMGNQLDQKYRHNIPQPCSSKRNRRTPPNLPALHHPLPTDLRAQFITQITQTKSRAKKHAAISTMLLLPALVIDTAVAIIWPFGGLFEVDAVWAFTSMRGYLVSRSVTRRLASQDTMHDHEQMRVRDRELYLRFQKSEEVGVVERYVRELCHRRDPRRFESAGVPPTETEVLRAIGWEPDLRGRVRNGERGGMPEGGVRDLDDERWQEREAKDDLIGVLGKGAKSWDNWCKKWEKNSKKAEKK
ncbi:hypothetical protein NHQ30_003627 [Ciborinia camelliae]|nr:hypothetical protein NHQ30_003627 [Ciborinia camelliae]